MHGDEQRLAAMLQELEIGLQRSHVLDHRNRRGRIARLFGFVEKRKSAPAPEAGRLPASLRALAAGVAMATGVGVFASLSGAETPGAPVQATASAPEESAVADAPMVEARSSFGAGAQPNGLPTGLSVEEFNARVRSLFAQGKATADGMRPAIEEPTPLPPPRAGSRIGADAPSAPQKAGPPLRAKPHTHLRSAVSGPLASDRGR